MFLGKEGISVLFKVLYSCEVAFLVGFTPDTDELMALGGLVLDCQIFAERDFFIDNQLVRIHFIIEMIWWIGLAPWESEFPCPGCHISTVLGVLAHTARPAVPNRVVAGVSGRRVVHCSVPHCHLPTRPSSVQGYLTYKKTPPPRTLSWVHA